MRSEKGIMTTERQGNGINRDRKQKRKEKEGNEKGKIETVSLHFPEQNSILGQWERGNRQHLETGNPEFIYGREP